MRPSGSVHPSSKADPGSKAGVEPTPGRPDPRLLGLLATAFAAAVLSVVQWWELLDVRRGGEAFCRVGRGLDCTAVWETPAAQSIHAWTGVPVAGWGLVWALGALVTAALVWNARRRGRADAVALSAVRIFAFAGVFVVLGLLGVSLRAGVLCLTCVGTYGLVGTYAVLAVCRGSRVRPEAGGPPPRRPGEGSGSTSGGAKVALGPLGRSVALAAGLVLAGYLAVLGPGRGTPVRPEGALAAPEAVVAAADPLRRFLSELPGSSRRALWDALTEYRSRPAHDVSRFSVRRVTGPAFAPTHIVEFSDILCGHCRRLNHAMGEVAKHAPKGSFRREVRMFPLDAECNPKLAPQSTDGSGTRCAGARVLICLETHESYESVKDQLYREQTRLDVERVFRIAEEGSGLSRGALERCVRASDTERRLRDDIEYAWLYGLKGTPLVVINGKEGRAVGPFIFAIILAGGDPHHPAFDRLVPAS